MAEVEVTSLGQFSMGYRKSLDFNAISKDEVSGLFSGAFRSEGDDLNLKRGLVDLASQREERKAQPSKSGSLVPVGASPRRSRTNHLGIKVNKHGRPKYK